ncbi:MAG: 50S ribosomal protein L35 [Candidatus Woykebacteria bacterium]
MKTKHKTKKGAAKRFKLTAKGHILKKGGYSSHLKEKKSNRRLRKQKEPTRLVKGDKKRIIKLLK